MEMPAIARMAADRRAAGAGNFAQGSPRRFFSRGGPVRAAFSGVRAARDTAAPLRDTAAHRVAAEMRTVPAAILAAMILMAVAAAPGIRAAENGASGAGPADEGKVSGEVEKVARMLAFADAAVVCVVKGTPGKEAAAENGEGVPEEFVFECREIIFRKVSGPGVGEVFRAAAGNRATAGLFERRAGDGRPVLLLLWVPAESASFPRRKGLYLLNPPSAPFPPAGAPAPGREQEGVHPAAVHSIFDSDSGERIVRPGFSPGRDGTPMPVIRAAAAELARCVLVPCVRVDGLLEGSQGEARGMKSGDFLLSYDGRGPLADMGDVLMARDQVMNDPARAGADIEAVLEREGRRIVVTLKPGPLGAYLSTGYRLVPKSEAAASDPRSFPPLAAGGRGAAGSPDGAGGAKEGEDGAAEVRAVGGTGVKTAGRIPAGTAGGTAGGRQAGGAADASKGPAGTGGEGAAAADVAGKIEALVRGLDDDDFFAREKAQKELEALGTPAIPYLERAAAAGNAEVAMRARTALGRIRASNVSGRICLVLSRPDGGPANLGEGWVLDARTRETRMIPGSFGSLTSLAVSPDGSLALYSAPSSSAAFDLFALDVRTGKRYRLTRSHYSALTGLAFDPEGRRALFGATRREIGRSGKAIWKGGSVSLDLASGRIEDPTAKGCAGEETSKNRGTGDGAGAEDGEDDTAETGGGDVLDGRAGVAAPRFSPDGKPLLAIRCFDETGQWLGVRDTGGTGATREIYRPRPGSAIQSFCWSPDGSHIAVAETGAGNRIVVVAADGTASVALKEFDRPITGEITWQP